MFYLYNLKILFNLMNDLEWMRKLDYFWRHKFNYMISKPLISFGQMIDDRYINLDIFW
jgi:hypothetical protein